MNRKIGTILLLALGLGLLTTSDSNLPLAEAQSSQTYHQTLQIGRRVPLAVDWNSSGTMLATVGSSEARVYTQNLIELAYIEVPGTVSGANWHPNENLLAILTRTDTGDKIYIWDVSTSTLDLLVEVDPDRSSLSSIRWSPDGNFIASSSRDSVAIWNAVTGEETARLFGSHPSGFNTVSWTSQILIAGSELGLVDIWDVSNVAAPSHLHTLTVRDPSPLIANVLSPDGSLLATADREEIHIWNVTTGSVSLTLQGHDSNIFSLFWNNLGLASVSFGDRINIWSVNEQQIISSSTFTASAGINTLVSQIAWSADLTKLISYDLVSKTLQVWDISTGNSLTALKGYTGSIDAIAWSPDSMKLVSAGLQSDAYIWDAESGDMLIALGTPRPFYAVAWGPDDKVAIENLGMRVYDAQTGNLLFNLDGNSAIAWNPDGSLIATGGENNSIKIWSEDGSLLQTLEGHNGRVLSLSWSPSGQLIASTGIDATVRIWDIANSQNIITFEQQTVSLTVTWSPSGRLLASGGSQSDINVIYVWDVDLEILVTTLAGHSSTINSVSWRFDDILASGSNDGTVRIWNVTNSQEVSVLEHGKIVTSVAWSPNGNKLASGGQDGTIRIWQEESSVVCDVSISTSDATSLISAITTANMSGDPTTICLAEESTYSFDSAVLEGLNHYDNALPTITGNIIIEGNGATLARDSSTSIPDFRFFTVSKFAHLALNNLTLENGRFGTSGGAIYSGGTVEVNGVEFAHNYAENGGGAIYNTGTLTINTSVFAENGTFYNESGAIQNKGYGGAIYNTAEGIIQVTDTQFTDNQASFGGTIYNRGDLTFTQSSIEGSQSGENAGAIYNDTADAILSIMDSQFTDNQSRRATGGALVNIGGEVTITGSSFSGNQSYSKLTSPSSGHGGGAIAHYVGYVVDPSATGILSVSDSIFTGNSSMMSNGGAILVNGGATVDNSCISGNSNTSVYNILTNSVDFSGNWWGAANGPSGVGSGSGDSVGANIPYTPFLTASTCPLVP